MESFKRTSTQNFFNVDILHIDWFRYLQFDSFSVFRAYLSRSCKFIFSNHLFNQDGCLWKILTHISGFWSIWMSTLSMRIQQHWFMFLRIAPVKVVQMYDGGMWDTTSVKRGQKHSIVSKSVSKCGGQGRNNSSFALPTEGRLSCSSRNVPHALVPLGQNKLEIFDIWSSEIAS